MHLPAFRSLPVLLLFLASFYQEAEAQKATLLGLNTSIGIYPEWTKPLAGFVLEKRLKGKSGVETGLFFRPDRVHGIIAFTDPGGSRSYGYTINRSYLSLPVLYRYHTRLVVLSAGPVLDLFLGWKQTGDRSVRVDNYSENPGVKVGFLVKAGRMIPLGNAFVLEPEIRIGSVRGFNAPDLGLGLSGKYRF